MSAWGAPSSAIKSSSSNEKPITEEDVAAVLAEKKEIEKRDIFEHVEPIQLVVLEGVALLQIIKHCHDTSPNVVTGSLLGLEQDKKLQVTNTFPSPTTSSSGKSHQDSGEHEIGMMKHLQEVGMDNNRVGWYQSVHMGTYISASVIESQFQYQKSLGPNAICLFYDAFETRRGSLAIKAYRLKKTFYEAYKDGVFMNKSVFKKDIRSTNIFEEIPICIRNAELIQCYVQQLQEKHDTITQTKWDRLDLSSSAYLETNLKNIAAWADELAQEQFKFQGYERALAKQRAAYQQWLARQREESKQLREQGREDEIVQEKDPDFFKSIHQPPRLESLLITKQMLTYCEHINQHAGKSFHKLFLASKLHEKE